MYLANELHGTRLPTGRTHRLEMKCEKFILHTYNVYT